MPFHVLEPAHEAELVMLTCAAPAMDDRIRGLLRPDLNWDEVLALVVRERASPVFWRRVSRLNADAVPADVRQQLKRLSDVEVFRQRLLEKRLKETIELLGAAEIDVLLLKGAGLATTVYGSFEERPMADIDLLIRSEQAPKAYHLLLEAGWTRRSAEPGQSLDALYSRHHHLEPLRDAGSGLMLEVHIEPLPIGNPLRLSAEHLWRDAVPVSVGQRLAFAPSNLSQVLHVCCHFAWAHCMESGVWRTLRDLRVLAEVPRLDWDPVARLAHEAQAATCVYWPLRLARRLVGAAVPPAILTALAPSRSERVLQALERHFVVTLFGSAQCPSPRLARMLWEAAIDPDRNGHGESRPWRYHHSFADAGVLPADPQSRLIRSAWVNFQGWHRYVQALVQ